MTTGKSGLSALRQLARLNGVQGSYYGVDGARRTACVDSLLATLQALGFALDTPVQAPDLLREYRQREALQAVEPVTVAWEDKPAELYLRLPAKSHDGTGNCTLFLEQGDQEHFTFCPSKLPIAHNSTVEGVEYNLRRLSLPKLPLGYHRLILELPGLPSAETCVISAPTKAHRLLDHGTQRSWGAFLPLYSLHTEREVAATGDFGDLSEMTSWIGEQGGSFVATLPILATFLDHPCEPSPYMPVSRMMWNEFYLQLSAVPELQNCPSAQALLESDGYRKAWRDLRRSDLVDYQREMRLKREVLMEVANHVFSSSSACLRKMDQFLNERPEVESYARFRATMRQRGETWPSWPERLRRGDLRPGEYDDKERFYHSYVQYAAQQQIERLTRKGLDRGVELYLDLPLGIHPDGYDVWRHQDLFVKGVSAGAPPDSFFSQGQNWGFPPLHPQALRRSGYDYFIKCLRHHLRTSGLLRIDHVMGFHRLFWIPQGMEGQQGVYIRYYPEEFYAILTLESHRNKCSIVGEDLGTVPPKVRPAMRRHGIYGMHVSYFQMAEEKEHALRHASGNVLASVNTHDLPPFLSFWQGLDVSLREELGHQNHSWAEAELQRRRRLREAVTAFLRAQGLLDGGDEAPSSVLKALLAFLGSSEAPMVLVNLEDLWAEQKFQNVPGTGSELPNWRRRARHDFEGFQHLPQVLEGLEILREFRNPTLEAGK